MSYIIMTMMRKEFYQIQQKYFLKKGIAYKRPWGKGLADRKLTYECSVYSYAKYVHLYSKQSYTVLW